ncbi:ATP-binding protein [Candidatus Omnitrophota bacterium]
MSKCQNCAVKYSAMWNLCALCRGPLTKDNPIAKILSKTKNDDLLLSVIESTLDQANAIILYLDKDLKPIMCNNAIEDITGYSRNELFKADWLSILCNDNASRVDIFKAALNSCLSSIKSRTYEGSISKKDGGESVLFWRNAAVTDSSDNIIGIICTAQDITERKITEEDVAIQAERLRDIFASIKDYGFIATNLDDKITYYGAGATELFGWGEDVTFKDISIIFKDSDKDIKGRIIASIEKSGRFEEEVQLSCNKETGVFEAMLSVRALLSRNYKRSGYVFIIRDIAERKKLEMRMIENEKLAAIGQLAAGVAHEINNPLLVILGRLEILAMDGEKFSQPVTNTLDIIKAQAERMRIIVDRLLSYARRKSPHMDLVNVNDVLKTIYPLVIYYPEFKKISWNEELEGNLPNIRGDFNQLQELFLNLGLNACQAMPEGGAVVVRTKLVDEGFIEVFIDDTGVGIGDENIQKLFAPFFTTKDSGTGLGLSICQNITESHGGIIEVDSTLNKGTSFKIRFPVAKDKE